MRKLTGYIGALIIVFALAGSVLSGYALNINGQSAVVNEYEHVTDVSGLYSYSDQKTYIDYNPASNYIGYEETYTEQNGQLLTYSNHYKSLSNGTVTVKKNTVRVSIDGGAEYAPSLPYYAFVCDYFYLYYESGTNLTYYPYDHAVRTPANDVIITISGNTVNVKDNGSFNHTYTGVKNMLAYTGTDDWEYRCTIGTYTLPLSGFYLNDVDQVVGTTTGGSDGFGIYTGNTWRAIGSSTTATVSAVVSNGDNRYTINDVRVSWGVFYPKSVTFTDIGINYAVSNRVNNYPVVVNPSDTSTQTTQLTLTNISASSVWPVTQYNVNLTDLIIYKKVVTKVNTPDRIFSPEWATPDYNNEIQNVNRNYRLSDILSTLSIPSNVKTITIDANSGEYFNVQFGPYAQYGYAGYTARIDKNLAGFTNIDEYQTNETLYYNDIYGEKDYIVYNTETGIASIYDYTGVKKSSNTPDKIAVGFVLNIGNNYTQATGYWWYNDQNYSYGAWNDLSSRFNPYINITYTIVNPGSITYMDITKGVSIDSDNIDNVTWDNEYENGNIQLLFRAENINNSYHNDLTISGNDISIDYTDSRYYITLNTGEPVDIGMWRNIILNIDLVNGKLSVVPVRTFNSYTNVQVDKTTIPIGDLIGAAPTNTMTWKPTNNSLTFNIYSTSVFMNTYGVVMFNPALNITDYFTELNNFYELKLTNFSIFGDSITVNGETYPVDGNKLTVDDETLIIKDLSIIYADGRVYLEDSHISIDIGEITDNVISMAGAWYFQTELLKGYTAQKMVYEWDWAGFIFDNTQFCIFYIGLAVAALLIARKFCQVSMIDYAVFIVSIIIALGVQVIA